LTPSSTRQQLEELVPAIPDEAQSIEAVPLNEDFLWAIRWFSGPEKTGELLGTTSMRHQEFLAFWEGLKGKPWQPTRENGEPIPWSEFPTELRP